MKYNEFEAKVDAKFGSLQKFIYNCKDIDDDTKENMICLCIECNDMICKIAKKKMK